MRKNWLAALIGVIVLLALCGMASAEKLIIPADVKIIDVEAFYGDTNIDEVVLPEGLEEIRDRAFANSGLRIINLPSTLKSISESAFDENVLFTANEGTDIYSLSLKTGYIKSPTSYFTFRVIDDEEKTCALQSYDCKDDSSITIISIPAYNDDGYKVTTIWTGAFNRSIYLTDIYIPDGIIGIGTNAFYNCTELTNIHIPESVESLGINSFFNCEKLSSIHIPSKETILRQGVFADCKNLTEINIPNSVTSIGQTAFYGCSSLSEIIIPDSVTSIGRYAFEGCSSLSEITVPDSVTDIGREAFNNCTDLTSIRLPSNLTDIKEGLFKNCSSLMSISFPDSVTSIGQSAFYGCSSLSEITVPDSITGIGKEAFNECTNLTSIRLPSNLTDIKEGLFKNCSSLISISIPDSVASIGKNSFSGCVNLNNIDISENSMLTNIGETAFYGCTSLMGINIPDSVTNIGKEAFSFCNKITNIKLPTNLTSIENGLFKNCYALKSINISEGITSIGNDAFYRCENLENIDIPDSVTSIGSYSFYSCKKLQSVIIPESVTAIAEGTFAFCNSLTKIEIPDSVISIGALAISGFNLDLLVLCDPGSVALTYAKENQLDYFSRVNGKRKALLIGYTYPDQRGTEGWMHATVNDIAKLQPVLESYGFEVKPYVDQVSKEDLGTVILNELRDATETDISLFYYIGHGLEVDEEDEEEYKEYTGALIDNSHKYITLYELISNLQSVKGRKIVILDSCYSGYMITDVVPSIQDSNSRSEFYIFTACKRDEKVLYQGGILNDIGTTYHLYTRELCNCLSSFTNRALYITEINSDVSYNVAQALESEPLWRIQNKGDPHPQFWPTDCYWFKPFRTPEFR